jgi:crotonobetainyl-CoA:carnitine CoA-transferase CaiB-like acyl-CoA transferase
VASHRTGSNLPAADEGAPLAGVRIIAVEQFGAGPWATLQLAALGATVIKVEDPAVGGDVGRYVVPFQEGENSLFFETFNRGKKSISLDLRHASAKEVLHRLAAHSHALFCNLRGDLPRRLGLTYETLAPSNRAIVCCSLSGFGTDGPRAAQGAYDYAIQGHAGWMSLTGEPGGLPTRSGLSLVDFCGGFAAAIAMLAALARVQTTGEGCDCDVSLYEVALALNTYVATWALSRDWVPERMAQSAHPSLVPFQLFPTSDGWIVICCAKEALFGRLCAALDLGWMAEDGRFNSFAARERNRTECVELLSERLRDLPTAAWIATLENAGVPCGPVNNVAKAFSDPQAVARGVVQEYEHAELGTVRAARSAIRVGERAEEPRRGPYRGEHTHELLTEMCGYTDAEVEQLAAAGVFGDAPRKVVR